MKSELIEILACPKCKGSLNLLGQDQVVITEGSLACADCSDEYPIENGIPRFVVSDNYGSSFGYQWNLFRKEQLDTHNGTTLSADRFWKETGWSKDELKNKWVLDAGCGAGRFLDAASQSDGQIVGIDISNAIDAAKANLEDRQNVHFIQASIYELPFREGTFDFCYCIGVVQHTPEPDSTLRTLASKVRVGGEIALTIYPRKFYTKLYSKYWLRLVTRSIAKERLLRYIENVMPIAFPITNFLFRLPLLGKVFRFAIPIANYVEENQLSTKQRYDWAILDTFDMLSPFYDQPMTEKEVANALSSSGVEIRRGTDAGLNIVGRKS